MAIFALHDMHLFTNAPVHLSYYFDCVCRYEEEEGGNGGGGRREIVSVSLSTAYRDEVSCAKGLLLVWTLCRAHTDSLVAAGTMLAADVLAEVWR